MKEQEEIKTDVNDTDGIAVLNEGKDAVKTVAKDAYFDEMALQSAAMISAASDETEKHAPSFFLEEGQRVRVDVDIISNPENGKIMSVVKSGLFESKELSDLLVKTSQWFEFTIPTFEEISLYRQQSSRYIRRENVVDINSFRNFIIIGHLKDWSLTDKSGEKVVLEKEADGQLTKESLALVNRVHVVIWDVVMTLLERETLIL